MKKIFLILIFIILSLTNVYSQIKIVEDTIKNNQKSQITQLSYDDITKNPKWKLVYDYIDNYLDIELNKPEIYFTWFEFNPSASWSAGDHRHYYGKSFIHTTNSRENKFPNFIAYTLGKNGYCSYFGNRYENVVWFTQEGQTMLDAYVKDNNKFVLSKDNKGVYVDKIITPNKNFSFYLRYSFPINDIDSVIDAEFKNSNVVKITYKNFGYEYWLIIKINENKKIPVNKDERLIYTAGNPHNYSEEELNNYIENFGKDLYMGLGKTYSNEKEKFVLIPLGHEPKSMELQKFSLENNYKYIFY